MKNQLIGGVAVDMSRENCLAGLLFDGVDDPDHSGALMCAPVIECRAHAPGTKALYVIDNAEPELIGFMSGSVVSFNPTTKRIRLALLSAFWEDSQDADAVREAIQKGAK